MSENPGGVRPEPDAALAGADHSHGPVPSFEWILEGVTDTVVPHLKTIAPILKWNEQHFHVSSVRQEDPDLPERNEMQVVTIKSTV